MADTKSCARCVFTSRQLAAAKNRAQEAEEALRERERELLNVTRACELRILRERVLAVAVFSFVLGILVAWVIRG